MEELSLGLLPSSSQPPEAAVSLEAERDRLAQGKSIQMGLLFTPLSIPLLFTPLSTPLLFTPLSVLRSVDYNLVCCSISTPRSMSTDTPMRCCV